MALKASYKQIEQNVENLDEREYLKRNKRGYCAARKAILLGVYIILFALVVLFVELIMSPWLVSEGYKALAVFVFRAGIVPNILTGLAYSAISLGLFLIVFGCSCIAIYWPLIGLSFVAVNTANVPKGKAPDRNNAKPSAKKEVKESKPNEAKTKIKEPDYYDIDCPHCGGTVSVDKSFDYEGDFCCPFCNEKIDI